MHLLNDFHWGTREEAVGKREKNNKWCPLHDADLKNQAEGGHGKLPKSKKAKCQKAGLGKSFEPFGLLLRLSMPFIEKALQKTRSDWSAPARRPANLTDKYPTHVI